MGSPGILISIFLVYSRHRDLLSLFKMGLNCNVCNVCDTDIY